MNGRPRTPVDTQRGVGMIEVLITVLVLSIGLLGLAALQGFSLQGNQVSYQRTQATNIAYEIIDDMRANRRDVRNGDYTGESYWLPRVQQLLPGATLQIQVDSDDHVQITIEWADDERVTDDEDEHEAWSFQVSSRI